jgi:hypothetical protein
MAAATRLPAYGENPGQRACPAPTRVSPPRRPRPGSTRPLGRVAPDREHHRDHGHEQDHRGGDDQPSPPRETQRRGRDTPGRDFFSCFSCFAGRRAGRRVRGRARRHRRRDRPRSRSSRSHRPRSHLRPRLGRHLPRHLGRRHSRSRYSNRPAGIGDDPPVIGHQAEVRPPRLPDYRRAHVRLLAKTPVTHVASAPASCHLGTAPGALGCTLLTRQFDRIVVRSNSLRYLCTSRH